MTVYIRGGARMDDSPQAMRERQAKRQDTIPLSSIEWAAQLINAEADLTKALDGWVSDFQGFCEMQDRLYDALERVAELERLHPIIQEMCDTMEFERRALGTSTLTIIRKCDGNHEIHTPKSPTPTGGED